MRDRREGAQGQIAAPRQLLESFVLNHKRVGLDTLTSRQERILSLAGQSLSNAQTFRRLDTKKQKQRIISHEFGHTLGLAHARARLCPRSVMPTTRSCFRSGEPYRPYPGPHDRADLFDYWVDTPLYPIPNKCPTDACPASSGRAEQPGTVVEHAKDW
jgi:hypothetical protein